MHAFYLSSETLITPSSLGMITAVVTTSWKASILLSRTGRRSCGLGWISAAMWNKYYALTSFSSFAGFLVAYHFSGAA